ncbi:iron ABC transporter permease [Candidatus Epulonipiscium fishelsonii]|uniref:Iron ABC transporter permease n=1 Tax=Candidatus Epulonipiscium fishelsonii TaxID=77094 RepID=A0ACC8XGE5_9FIRM|nr:iron ABC transporter permease [Epulopiscium sp. SCG-B05WGA-EpuloA1]ONI42500.1 iron ABC transporter permease [Epulopiscium sp. SCG-B11WGA-EpuloA1]
MGTIKNTYSITIFMFLMLIVLSIQSIFIGVIDISVADIFAGNFHEINILLISRLPRLLAILCTGVGMSIAGLIMQQLCMNKFVSPTTGATISSAQLGVLVCMIIAPGAGILTKTSIAFVTSILGTWSFVFFAQKMKLKDAIMMPLIGIMFGNVIGGITTYFSYKYGLMQSLNATFVGDFSLIIRGRYEIVFLVVPLIIIAYIYANQFNIVGMGENFAKNLGINPNVVMFGGLSIVALITASIVVTVGTISYLGLIVPNLVALFRGDKIRGSMLDISIFGALFTLVCDILGRVLIAPYELPIDLIIGILGSVLFIGLMFKKLSPAKKIKVKQSKKIETINVMKSGEANA